jgi:hypothetical protein
MNDVSWAQKRKQVYERARGICEYCRVNEANTGIGMQVDHINPSGDDNLDNLCLACANCNGSKHKATTAHDPLTQENVPLFNPRLQRWGEHFEWVEGATIIRGRTAIGRATIARLQLNRPMMVAARLRWVENGYHPPDEGDNNS